jgi:uncharacterized protein
MTVDVRSLRAEHGARLVVDLHEAIPSQIAEVPFSKPVEGRLVLTNLGSVLHIDGRLGTQIDLSCDRCARPFRYRLEARIAEDFAWTGNDGLIMIDGDTVALDLQGLAREHLLLALPMVARCDELCEGLCDRCGRERRAGQCNCTDDPVDPRLAPLARWRRVLPE